MPLPKNKKVLRPLFPNEGIRRAYQARLDKMIDEMHASIMYWVKAKYKNNEPEAVMAADALPASILRAAINKLVKRWQRNWDLASLEMAKYFETDVEDRTEGAMKAILKRAGISVPFTMTPAMRDIASATVTANVSLIKSIPQQYLRNVEGIVMRSVQTGRDLGQLSQDLQKQHGVTKRRAALIARDQNNKATSAFTRARQEELGITEAVWMHSHAGKEPRPTHVKMNNQTYDIRVGMWDEDEGRNVFPGELINCRCTSKSVVEGFS